MAEKTLSVKLSLNDKQFQSALRKSTNRMKKFGKSMQRTGQTLSRNLTLPIVAFGGLAVKAFDEQIKAETKLRTALKGNTEAFENLTEQARELQKVTLFGDEATIEAQSFLAQLGLTEQQILMITPALQDFATGMGVDLKTAASLVGKTIGTSTDALKRYFDTGLNPAMTAQEKAIKLTETLTEKFGGQAKAIATEGLGPLQQLSNQLGDVNEQLGEIILEGIEPLKNILQVFADTLQGTSKETKESVVAFAGLAAIIGPILFIVGKMITTFARLRKFFLGSLIPALKVLGRALVALTPQGKIIAGVILAAQGIYTYWDDLVTVFDNVKSSVEKLLEKLGLLKKEEDIALDFSIQDQSGQVFTIEELRRRTAAFKGTKIVPKKKPVQMSQEEREGRARMAKRKAEATALPIIEPIKVTSVALKELKNDFVNLEPIVEDFEESLSGFDIVGNELSRSFESFGNVLQGTFAQALQSSDGFFKSFVEGSKRAMSALMAQLAATLALNALLGGSYFGKMLGLSDIGGVGGIGTALKGLFMADGGLATGATLAMVGEGPGTSMANPEVIAPLDKLKSMIGTNGGSTEVFGTISGADILLSSDRARKNRNRTRGY